MTKTMLFVFLSALAVTSAQAQGSSIARDIIWAGRDVIVVSKQENTERQISRDRKEVDLAQIEARERTERDRNASYERVALEEQKTRRAEIGAQERQTTAATAADVFRTSAETNSNGTVTVNGVTIRVNTAKPAPAKKP